MNPLTMTPAEAGRASETAWERYGSAKDERNSWANVIATYATRGETAAGATTDAYIVARAEAFESGADWREASDRYHAAREAS